MARRWRDQNLHDHLAPRLQRILQALPAVIVTSAPFQLSHQ